jgi:hypothetical protein
MQYILKLENGVPTGSLISIENLIQITPELKGSKKSWFASSELLPMGYGSFVFTSRPTLTTLEECNEVTPSEQNSDGEWIQKWEVTEKVFETLELKAEALLQGNTGLLNVKLAELKVNFEEASKRPRVDTGLGFFVDGGYSDLTNFQIGKELGLLVIKDADNIEHSIAIEDYDTILSAIKTKGLSLIQSNWEFKKLLNSIDLTLDTALIEIDAIGK